MAKYYRVVMLLTPKPHIDLTKEMNFIDMSVGQLAVLIINDELPVLGVAHHTLVISSTAKKNARAEWRRRNPEKVTLFGVKWATAAHRKTYRFSK